MATIQSRLVRLENRPATSQIANTRAYIEEINLAGRTDEKFRALVDDLRHAMCLADTDPSLPHQAALAIPRDVPSIEECKRRLAVRLAELRNL